VAHRERLGLLLPRAGRRLVRLPGLRPRHARDRLPLQARRQAAARFLLQTHPTDRPPSPIAKFDPHAATNGFAFSPGGDWGKTTDAFIALFGDMAPATGTVPEPQGFKVVRVDTGNGSTADFATNKIAGRASRYGGGGFEHPSDVAFGPDGAMYVTDWGVADITGDGVKLWKDSGVVWRISRTSDPAGYSVASPQSGATQAAGLGPTTLIYATIDVALFAAAVVVSWGRGPPHRVRKGALAGLVGGLAMGVAAIGVGILVYHLPWWAAPRILATMVMGRKAEANILEFDALSTVAGFVVLLAITTLWGLAGWMLFQFIAWPPLLPARQRQGVPTLLVRHRLRPVRPRARGLAVRCPEAHARRGRRLNGGLAFGRGRRRPPLGAGECRHNPRASSTMP
jgi:hypothetical protein